MNFLKSWFELDLDSNVTVHCVFIGGRRTGKTNFKELLSLEPGLALVSVCVLIHPSGVTVMSQGKTLWLDNRVVVFCFLFFVCLFFTTNAGVGAF